MRGLTLFVLIFVATQNATAKPWHWGSRKDRAGSDSERIPANFKDRFVFKTASASDASEEKTFQKILRPSSIPGEGEGYELYGSGKSFLEQLELASKDQCIPRIVVLSHGWGTTRIDGGMGLPIVPSRRNGEQNTSQSSGSLASYPATGFYLSDETRSREVKQSYEEVVAGIELSLYSSDTAERFRKRHNRPITESDIQNIRTYMLNLYDPKAIPGQGYRIKSKEELYAAMEEESKTNSIEIKDLQKSIAQNRTRFCAGSDNKPGCKIEFYSCNMHEDFIKSLALSTGCEIVYGTGMVSYQSGDNGVVTVRGDRSSKKVEVPGQKPKYINLNNRDGQFVRVTPQKDGTVKPEKIGYRYTFQ